MSSDPFELVDVVLRVGDRLQRKSVIQSRSSSRSASVASRGRPGTTVDIADLAEREDAL